MQQQEPSKGGPIADMQFALHVILVIARVLATPLETISRRNFGIRFFGFQALGAFLLLPMWPVFWEGSRPFGMVVFWWLFVAMLIRARIESMRLARTDNAPHTLYNGLPRLCRLLRWMPERQVKRVAEPILWATLGLLVLPLNVALGAYFIIGAVSIVVVQSTLEAVEQARVLELNDAWLEQQFVAARVREMWRGRR